MKKELRPQREHRQLHQIFLEQLMSQVRDTQTQRDREGGEERRRGGLTVMATIVNEIFEKVLRHSVRSARQVEVEVNNSGKSEMMLAAVDGIYL
jgi:hypothetical protein